MKRSLLVMALCVIAAPAYCITASVTSSTPGAAPNAPSGSVAANAAPNISTNAATGKTTASAPSAATVTQPAAALSAPGVPMQAQTAAGARTSTAKSAPKAISPGPTLQAGTVAPAPNSAKWAAIGRTDSGMRRGTLQAINVNPGTMQVYGQKLNFNPQRVKVITREGKPGSIYSVKPGTAVRFTMDATDRAQRRVAVIYID
jgi:hypothetical protein